MIISIINSHINMDLLHNHPVEVQANVANIEDLTYLNLQIKAPSQPPKRMGAAVICVLDISGSMDVQATQAGKAESDGFTRLDLVKHSVNTIIHSLDDGDFLGIVTFSTKARIDMPLSEMNAHGKGRALDVVKSMKTQGCTNLWDGIKNGLELSKNKICQNKNTFVVVLSDGQPNQHPQQGELEATRKYIEANPLTCSMSMFGYGYNLDTKLLAALTELGGGCYGYIPDCSFVGTIFVNFLSLVLSTCTPRMSIEVESEHAQIIQVNNSKSRVNLGPVQFGTTRNVLAVLKAPPGIDTLCNVKIRYGSTLRMQVDTKVKNEECGNKKKLQEQILRYKHIRLLDDISKKSETDINTAKEFIQPHYNKLQQFYVGHGKEDKFINGLMRDLISDNEQEGQVGISLSKQEYWNKWGIHYLPALRIAHELELCTNFKDPGLKLYIGPMFDKMQDNIDTIFIKLPPPEPSIKKYDQQGNVQVVDDMADYYDQYGGCIHGDCLVRMSNGVLKPVRNIVPGDEIITSNNNKSIVKCIVKTPMNQNLEMVKFETGLIITKYHPIIFEGSWRFPIDVKKAQKIYVDNFYNFILEDGFTMIINDIACITLGHEVQEEVARHQFLGSKRVIEDLEKLEGWRTGVVEVAHQMYRRDPVTHNIVGIY